jgi:hypothetical protein
MVFPAVPFVLGNFHHAKPAGAVWLNRIMVAQCRDIDVFPLNGFKEHFTLEGLNSFTVYR